MAKARINGWKGLSAGRALSSFNQADLRKGAKVEHEHTGDEQLARRIAADHLTEDPRYYQKLERMEEGELDRWPWYVGLVAVAGVIAAILGYRAGRSSTPSATQS